MERLLRKRQPFFLFSDTVKKAMSTEEFADGGISAMFFAPAANADIKRFSINLMRTSQNEIPTGGARLAIVTLTFTGIVQRSNMVTVVPFNNTTSGANWVNEVEGVRREVLGPINQALPVTLVSFEIVKEARTAKLKWVTSEETSSERFDVQRSKNGKIWSVFQTIEASGDSDTKHFYDVVDNDPYDGENLYRLHMIDKDGSSAFSALRSIFVESEPTLLFPNPVADFMMIKTGVPEKMSAVDIINSNGMNVYHSTFQIQDKVDVRKLIDGIYTVKIKFTNGEEKTQRIVIVR